MFLLKTEKKSTGFYSLGSKQIYADKFNVWGFSVVVVVDNL